MHYLFYLGHPAHFHLFRNTIQTLKLRGHKISLLIKKKDILEDLLKLCEIPYLNILPEGRGDSKTGLAIGVLKRDIRLFRFCLNNRPDLMIGTSVEIGHIGTILNIPSLNVNEDDANCVPMYSKLGYPFSSYILSPSVCKNGRWEGKSIKYEGYHELAYLHPTVFMPSKEVLLRYLTKEEPYSLIRFAKLNAHHDKGVKGITADIARNLILVLEKFGKVFITSERQLEPEFESYRISINPIDIHHIMAFAQVYIGDSQTMAAESGVLGVPFFRFNDFVGRLGYLNELENKYELGYGILPSNPEILYTKVEEVLQMKNRFNTFQSRRQTMLNDKIRLSGFLTWFIENYPSSVEIMSKDPGYQFNFKSS